ncbi:cupin domain-containing protein [Actinacidiphila sp. DG2A-62]|uniref:JmjC domain-containing protein n=1 Tax=Actinacidiphila sp. DG2A-62 TaxID=3108821 RepID=UPI002DBEAAA4|nr:cupin domain-containing protein [Actinacidiphila sp. DG2A-62]MEC3995274.1 cupin domain-containing protein [Actinacidiphila sp. DG2A-62]
MEHRLITAMEAALGWKGSGPLGGDFARGTIDDAALPQRILTPNRLLDLAMRRSLSNPQFRCFQNGEELHPNAYLTDEVTLRGQSLRMVNTHRLGTLLRQGATLVLDQVNTFDPTMEITCQALQWWSRERVQVNAYLTTNDASGFRLHWDDHDVLIVQLAGEKQWEVRGPSRTAPLYRDADRSDQPSNDIVWSGTMRTGDVMHIPRGYWHQATRNGNGPGKSLHMTFGFAKRTGVSWLSWLADWSSEHEIFRHDLDRTGHTSTQALTEAALELVRRRTPADFLTAREQEAPVPRHVPFLDIFGPLEAVACITHFPPQVTDHGDTVEVTAAGKKLTFRAKALPALRLLLSGHPAHLTQAAAQVGAEVEQVAHILVQEELCATLTPELSSGYTGLVTNAAP